MRLIDETPRIGIRGSRVAFLHPAASGGVLTEIVEPAEDTEPWPSASPSASRRARRSPCASATRSSTRLHDALGGEGWHDVDGEDGTVRLNLAHVLWLRTERDEHRVGFGLSS